jgi:hypothetical protein
MFRGIEVDYFSDAGKSDLNYFAVGTLDLDARCGQCLRSLHAANNAPDALTVDGDDLDVIFAVKRLKGRKGLGNFHDLSVFLPEILKIGAVVAASILHLSTGDVYLSEGVRR